MTWNVHLASRSFWELGDLECASYYRGKKIHAPAVFLAGLLFNWGGCAMNCQSVTSENWTFNKMFHSFFLKNERI